MVMSTTDVLPQGLQIPQINASRLMETLHSSCEFGRAHPWGDHHTETGMARLSLNDADKAVREWLISQVKSIGCTVTVDQMGNIFAVRAGKNPSAPPIMMGSHLDTQPTGGRYDGILGVVSALEVLRTLHETGYETEGNVGLIDWTNEEGARFPMITMASGVWAGVTTLEKAWSCIEITPNNTNNPSSTAQTFKEELTRIGFLGSTPASYSAQPIAAHFELHIEQGPILEDEGLTIGVVTGAQAYQWFEVTVRGRDCHAGTTPFSARKDALLAAAKMIVASNRIAKDENGLITTGVIAAEPGSVNTMAHTVKFTLDVRHPQDEALETTIRRCRQEFDRIANEDCERGVSVEWTAITGSPAVGFHADCISVIEQAAEHVCQDLTKQNSNHQIDAKATPLWKHMTSGAAHDSCHVSKRCPTAMVFTPTRNGMSHTPDEYCSPEDCALGAQVLMGAVLRYDALRAQRGDFAV